MKLLTPFIYLSITIAIVFMFITPKYESTKDLNLKIADNQEKIKLAIELRNKQTKLQEKNVAISQDERGRLEKILPETVDNVRLIMDISNIGDFTVVKNIGISGEIEEKETAQAKTKNISGNADYGSLQLSFSFVSGYEEIKTFFRRLEDSLRLVDIKELNINSVASNSAASQYDVNIKLNTYWLR